MTSDPVFPEHVVEAAAPGSEWDTARALHECVSAMESVADLVTRPGIDLAYQATFLRSVARASGPALRAAVAAGLSADTGEDQ